MSLIPIVIIGIVIASVANAMKNRSSSSQTPNFGKEFRNLIQDFNRPRPAVTTQRIERKDQVAAKSSYFTDIKEEEMAEKVEDLETDFGDVQEKAPIVERSIRSTQISRSNRIYNEPIKKTKNLDLKPTPKKLAEAFILAECFQTPRAKRPYRPRTYTKR